MQGSLNMGENPIVGVTTVDGRNLTGVHLMIIKVDAETLGRPETHPPTLVTIDNVNLWKFTLNFDRARYKFPIPFDYAGGDIGIRIVWTNDGETDDVGKNVTWEISYKVAGVDLEINGNDENSPKNVTDTYTTSSGWIENHSAYIILEEEELIDEFCVYISIRAITTDNPLTCEPHLIGICLEYLAWNVSD